MVLAFFSGNVASLSILASLYFFLMRGASKLKIILLGFLFIAISLRVLKSIIFFSGSIPSLGIAMGFFGLACIGPIIWFYFQYQDKPNTTRIQRKDYVHLLPAIIGSIILAIVPDFSSVFYRSITALLFIYLAFSFIRCKNTSNFKYNSWNFLLLVAVALMGVVFVLQFYMNTIISYAMGTVAIAIILLVIVVGAIKTNFLALRPRPAKKLNPQLIHKVKNTVEIEKVYLEPTLTLDSLGRKLDIPSYMVSQIIKKEYKKTFPETINHFRINDAIEELNESLLKETKIESIAYNVGFNTPSAFYSAFRKTTGMNPTEYQKKYLLRPEGRA
ncbi:AraC family transcriptional regulator [Flagellimonas sp. CMM7]|uniref:helix-turn-helix domain-containing protein n=1 Tax=Flagellimonas sp. CMM7 TaxID=2654676 RepID=UPI0013CF8F68|nr:helix-turn-helix domain-containing protein [Flagellimonas sp. CMM7]UII81120.1 helix-turn-helix domain-containing protein [Flagellimonas sp. CMM7]